jgi:hypothetical protein
MSELTLWRATLDQCLDERSGSDILRTSAATCARPPLNGQNINGRRYVIKRPHDVATGYDSEQSFLENGF